MDKCGNCKFFFKTEESENQGLCRRYPAQVVLIDGNMPYSIFPSMTDDGWCGEFKEKQ